MHQELLECQKHGDARGCELRHAIKKYMIQSRRREGTTFVACRMCRDDTSFWTALVCDWGKSHPCFEACLYETYFRFLGILRVNSNVLKSFIIYVVWICFGLRPTTQ